MTCSAWLEDDENMYHNVSLVLGMKEGVLESTNDDPDLMIHAIICWLKEGIELAGWCT
jgi:hypothetical protein